MEFRYLMLLLSLCFASISWAQHSNATAGGFMSHVNSWISRLRGGHNNNSNNNSDKDEKKEQSKPAQPNQMSYPSGGMVPYPIVPNLYGPSVPLGMPFGPRPMAPPSPFGPPIAPGYGSMTAGSSLGPSLMPGLGSGFPSINPNFPVNSPSNLVPVHPEYSSSNQDFPVSFGVGSAFGNSFGGLGTNMGSSIVSNLGPNLGPAMGSSLGSNLGPSLGSSLGSSLSSSLGTSLGPSNYGSQQEEPQMDDNSYQSDDSNGNEEYAGYQR